jgi:predicted nucleic acid-binding protein
MNALVIDASVAVKWVIEEIGTAEALRLRRAKLLAPDLVVGDCANILWKKVQRRELSIIPPAIAFILRLPSTTIAPLSLPTSDCCESSLSAATGSETV